MFEPLRPQAQPLKLPHCVIDSDHYQRPRYRYFKGMGHYWRCGRFDVSSIPSTYRHGGASCER